MFLPENGESIAILQRKKTESALCQTLSFATFCHFFPPDVQSRPAFCQEDGDFCGPLYLFYISKIFRFNILSPQKATNTLSLGEILLKVCQQSPSSPFSSPRSEIAAESFQSRCSFSCSLQFLTIMEEIYLILPRGTLHLLQSPFNCATLTLLKLQCAVIELNIAGSVSMPNLKVFHVRYGSIRDLRAGSFTRLLCGSPILEELVIHRMCGSDSVNPNFAVVSSSLKTFQFRSEGAYVVNNNDDNHLVIDPPKLEFLDLRVKRYDIELKNTPSVLNASIIDSESHCRSGVRKIPRNLWTITNVKVLSLSMFMIKDPLVFELIHFTELKNLVLRYCGKDDLSILPQILKRLPRLEHLKLCKYCCCHKSNTGEGFELEKSEIHCMKYSLKTLELQKFACHKEEMAVLKYFVQNSRVLNEIRLSRQSSFGTRRGIPFLKKLLTFPRCSNAFRVIFSD